MRASWGLALAALVLVAFAPAASAGISLPNRHFSLDVPFDQDLSSGGGTTMVSGRIRDLTTSTNEMTVLVINVTAVTWTGIDRVCWNDSNSFTGYDCRDGSIRVDTNDGSSFGFCFPGKSKAQLSAAQALGVFAKYSGGGDSTELTISRAFAATLLDGSLTMTVPSIPVSTPDSPPSDCANAQAGLLIPVDDETTFVVKVDGAVVKQSKGSADGGIAIQGTGIHMSEASPAMILMSAGTDLEARFTKATPGNAAKGLAIDRIADGLERFGADTGDFRQSVAPIKDLLPVLVNGALFKPPVNDPATNKTDLTTMGLYRFSSLDVSVSGSEVHFTGSGPLVIQDGKVRGAQPLVGFWYIQVPWWAILLWVLAIGAFIARMVLKEKAPKEHPKWDRFRWIGTVSGIVAVILVFLMWDSEIKGVFGASLLSGAKGAGLAFVAVLEIPFLGLVSLLAQRPLKILLNNVARISKQGTFMGLAAPIATLLGYFLAAPLLLAYLQFALKVAT